MTRAFRLNRACSKVDSLLTLGAKPPCHYFLKRLVFCTFSNSLDEDFYWGRKDILLKIAVRLSWLLAWKVPYSKISCKCVFRVRWQVYETRRRKKQRQSRGPFLNNNNLVHHQGSYKCDDWPQSFTSCCCFRFCFCEMKTIANFNAISSRQVVATPSLRLLKTRLHDNLVL